MLIRYIFPKKGIIFDLIKMFLLFLMQKEIDLWMTIFPHE